MTDTAARAGAAAGPTAEPPSILAGPLRVTTLGIVGLVSLIAFEAMAVATALPTAVAELRGLAWYGWSFTALLVTSVVGMVVAGELSDRVGARRPLLLGVVAFLAGLVVAGLAPAMAVFVLGRALQGLGVGLLVVVMYVLVGEAYPEALRPKVFGAISAAWVLPALVGPVVAGWLAQGVGWRWAFLGLVPLVVVGAVLLVPTVRQLRRPASRSSSGRRRARAWSPGRRRSAASCCSPAACVYCSRAAPCGCAAACRRWWASAACSPARSSRWSRSSRSPSASCTATRRRPRASR